MQENYGMKTCFAYGKSLSLYGTPVFFKFCVFDSESDS